MAASVVVVGAACRELLHFQPLTNMHVSLTGEVEDFFFEPSDSSPLVVLGLCAWLLWRRRRRLSACWGSRGPIAVTAACWAIAIALFSWSIRVGAPDLQALALIPALLGAGNLLGGIAAVRPSPSAPTIPKSRRTTHNLLWSAALSFWRIIAVWLFSIRIY